MKPMLTPTLGLYALPVQEYADSVVVTLTEFTTKTCNVILYFTFTRYFRESNVHALRYSCNVSPYIEFTAYTAFKYTTHIMYVYPVYALCKKPYKTLSYPISKVKSLLVYTVHVLYSKATMYKCVYSRAAMYKCVYSRAAMYKCVYSRSSSLITCVH